MTMNHDNLGGIKIVEKVLQEVPDTSNYVPIILEPLGMFITNRHRNYFHVIITRNSIFILTYYIRYILFEFCSSFFPG